MVVREAHAGKGCDELFDGKSLWTVTVQPRSPIGTMLDGTVHVRGAAAWLQNPLILVPSFGAGIAESATKRTQSAAGAVVAKSRQPIAATQPEQQLLVRATGDLGGQGLSDLQLDEVALRDRAPTIAKLLGACIDASMNGHRITAFSILAHLASIVSDSILPSAVKARYTSLALASLERMQLQPLVSRLFKRLSPTTIGALEPDTRTKIVFASKVGALKNKLEASERFEGELLRAFDRERHFPTFLDSRYFDGGSRVCDIVLEACAR